MFEKSKNNPTNLVFRLSARAVRRLAVALAIPLAAAGASADTFMVTSLQDDGGLGSLRLAVVLVNALPGPHTIEFAPDLAGGEIKLNFGEIEISRNLTVNGLGADQLTISGNNASRIFRLTGTGRTFNINDLTLADGNGVGEGAPTAGAVRTVGFDNTLNVARCVFRDNTAASRGTAIEFAFGTLRVIDCAFIDNLAGDGVIYAQDGTLVVRNTTVIGSTTTNGAIWARAAFEDANTTISHSTLVGNDVGLHYSTDQADSITVTYDHTIFANANNFRDGVGEGTLTLVSSGFNLISDADPDAAPTAPGDLLNTDPKLDALQAEAGSLILPLLSGSPAIDAGDPGAVAGVGPVPEFDQRGDGFTRVAGGRIDIGAVEFDTVDLCVADFNDDGVLNILDFVAFSGAFQAGGAQSDCNGDGALNVLDFVCFNTAFLAGCD